LAEKERGTTDSDVIEAILDENEFIIDQKLISLGNKYIIKNEERDRIAYCESESFFKEGLTVYNDESKEKELFSIKQVSLTKFTGLFEVLDHEESVVGYLRRKGVKSLVRDEWSILDQEKNKIGTARSDYLLKDLARKRYVRKIPYRYEIIQQGKKIGVYKQRFNLLKRSYKLQIKKDTEQNIDRRLLLSLSICLDAVEEKYRKLKYRKVF